ncbi:MAG: WD40 repeat domain-containing protein [Acidimicrobiales bacterium]
MRAASGHPGGVRSLAWSPDGTRLASGDDDGTVQCGRPTAVPSWAPSGATPAE